MKIRFLIVLTSVLALAGCVSTPSNPGEGSVIGSEQILPYIHIDGFGTETDMPSWIAWEFEAIGYVKYQIAYTSCTCRPDSINARSLLYVEVTKSEKGGKIRRISFDHWGDSSTMPSGITRKQVEDAYMPRLVGQRLDGIEAMDVMSGATVTTVNLRQISDALLAYHNAKYPAVGMNDDGDSVDATSAATGGEY